MSGKKERFDARGKLGGYVFTVCLVMMICFFAGILPLCPTVILTGSMEPQIEPGDMVIVTKMGLSNLAEGDIIQFSRDGCQIVHRIKELQKDGDGNISYITKGDANNTEDMDAVSEDDVVGKVILRIPKAGRFSIWLRSYI